jgi:COMPASS component SWD3
VRDDGTELTECGFVVAQLDRYYEILEILPGTPPQAVKQAYRTLARKWHPDRFSDPEEKAIAEAKFKQINRAYEQLKDYIPSVPPTQSAQRPAKSPQPVTQPPKPPQSPYIPTQGKSPQVIYAMAADYAKAGAYEAAIACLSAAIQAQPDYAMAYRYRGHLRSLLALERSANADLQTADALEQAKPRSVSGPPAVPIAAATVLPRATAIAQQAAPVTALAVRSDAGQIVSGSPTGKLYLWDQATGQLRTEVMAHVGQVSGLLVGAQRGQTGRLLFSAGADGVLKSWRWHSGRWGRQGIACRQTIDIESGAITAMAIARQHLITAGSDGRLQCWQIGWRGQLRCIEQIPAHQGAVLAVALSPNGDLIVSSGEDGLTYLWRLSMHVCLGSLPHKAAIATAIAFSPDGQRVAIGEASGWVEILRVTGEPGQIQVEQVLPAHTGTVRSIDWTANHGLVTRGDDQVIRVWPELSRSAPRATTVFDRAILSGVPHPTAHLYGTESGQIIAQMVSA